jgi:ssDNA-specific exonuclease RecJ
MASRSRILQVTYMWLFKVVFRLPHVVVTSGVIPTYSGVHKKLKIQESIIYP